RLLFGPAPGASPPPAPPVAPPPQEAPPPIPTAPTPAAPGASTPLTPPARQRDALLPAVPVMLRDATAGRPAVCPPLPWADRPIGGAYVSLKRGGHLRSCCGVLAQSVSLRAALEHASAHTAPEDVRFPPLSPTELPPPDVEVRL